MCLCGQAISAAAYIVVVGLTLKQTRAWKAVWKAPGAWVSCDNHQSELLGLFSELLWRQKQNLCGKMQLCNKYQLHTFPSLMGNKDSRQVASKDTCEVCQMMPVNGTHQGVVTPIHSILRASTVTIQKLPVTTWLQTSVDPATMAKTHRDCGIWSNMVKPHPCQNYICCGIVTSVTALSTVLIAVTTLCQVGGKLRHVTSVSRCLLISLLARNLF